MTQPNDGDPNAGAGTAAKTFTQAELDAIVRDRLKRERDATATKYADYDQLKSAAATAGENKSQLDKVLEKLSAAEERSSKLEAAQTRASVVADKKVPAWMAKRLTGATKEELEADADEMLAEWKASGGGKDDGSTGGGDPSQQQATTTATRGRPREALRSGAPVTPTAPDETDPRKLAALIPRN